MNRSIFQDWRANGGNPRSQLALASFRAAQAAKRLPAAFLPLGWPILALHIIFVEWFLGIELSYKAQVGPGLKLYHGVGLVVHESARIGANCTLRHCTTLGNRRSADDVPTIGDNVEIGCNAVLLGAIRVGDGARIAAGAIVLDDVAPGQTVAGNPARTVRGRHE